MVGLPICFCLPLLFVQTLASDPTAHNVATVFGYFALQQQELKGKAATHDMFQYFASKVNCSFPSSPQPVFLYGVSPKQCSSALLKASFQKSKYILTNARQVKVAVNGTNGFAFYLFDICGKGADGKCIPGTTVYDAKDILRYEFDSQHKISGYYDWWEFGIMEKVDSLVHWNRTGYKGVIFSNDESALFQNANDHQSSKHATTPHNVATVFGYAEQVSNVRTSKREFNALLSYFASEMSCTFPSSPQPVFLKGVSPSECFYAMGRSSFLGTKYLVTNSRQVNVAVNGTTGFGSWSFDICGRGQDGNCIPGTTVHDAKAVILYSFDSQHKIVGYDDWWEPTIMAKVDLLVQQNALTGNFDEFPFPHPCGLYARQMSGMHMFCALAKGC